MVAKQNYFNRIKDLYSATCASIAVHAEAHGRFLMLALGLGLLYTVGAEPAHAGVGTYNEACGKLLGLVEGSFGALVAAAAGVGAIVASALGGFKMAWALVVVSVGSFILRSYITLFNGTCAFGV